MTDARAAAAAIIDEKPGPHDVVALFASLGLGPGDAALARTPEETLSNLLADPGVVAALIEMEKRLGRPWRAGDWMVGRAIGERYGRSRSHRERAAIDGDGRPIPWMTYAAIEFLEGLDLTGARLFEFGSGNSTLYWHGRGCRVRSIEHDAAFHARTAGRLPPEVDYRLIEGTDAYAATIAVTAGETWDVVVIDGVHRRQCAEAAVGRLAPGGLLIVDNADWLPRTCAQLRAAGLTEVMFHGFTPINVYSSTTSIFMRGGHRFPYVEDVARRRSAAAHVQFYPGERP